MGDDFVTGGILPINVDSSDDADFDPDAVESDAFLDDPAEVVDDPDLPAALSEESDLFEEE